MFPEGKEASICILLYLYFIVFYYISFYSILRTTPQACSRFNNYRV